MQPDHITRAAAPKIAGKTLLIRAALIVGWVLVLLLAHGLIAILYVVPFLALATFFFLPTFPILLTALFLSAYLQNLATAGLEDPLKVLLIGATWLAALVVIVWQMRARTTPSRSDSSLRERRGAVRQGRI